MSEKQIVVEDRLVKPSMVTPTLFVGLGGWGCKVIGGVARQLKGRPDYHERYKHLVKFAGVDTNINDLEKLRVHFDADFLISDFEKAKYAELANGRLFLEPDSYFTQWVPSDYRFRVGDTAGAGQIRIESRLGCYYQMKHTPFVDKFRALIESLRDHQAGHRRLDSGEIRIVLCYSTAGGTGSGSHLAMAYMLRDQAKLIGKPVVIGLAGLPAIFEDHAGVNKDGIFANGYAALKETEHLMRLGAPESKFYPENGLDFHYDPSDETKRKVFDKPFDFLYVVDKPEKFSVKSVDQAAADGLYLQLFTDIFKEQAGDYDNYTQHQRFLVPHDFEAKEICGFTSFYGSFGAAVLHVPTRDMIDYSARATALNVLRGNWLRDIPAGDAYERIRIEPEPYYQVAKSDTEDEIEVQASEFGEHMEIERKALQDRLYLKRVRMLARAEYDKRKMNGQYLSVWRHGEGITVLPGSDPRHRLRMEKPTETMVDELRKAVGARSYEVSVAEMVLPLIQMRDGNAPQLIERAVAAVTEAAGSRLQMDDNVVPVSDLVAQARAAADDLYSAGESVLEEGFTDNVQYHGFSRICDAKELLKQSKVDIRTQRYIAIRLLDELNEIASRLAMEQGDAPEIKLPEGVQESDEAVIELGMFKGGKVIKEELLSTLRGQAVARAEFRVRETFRARISTARESFRDVADKLRALEDTVDTVCREEERQLQHLIENGSAGSNRYMLDAEALQMENGRRLWDFFYEDCIAGDMAEKFSLKSDSILSLVNEAYANGITGEPSEKHRQLLRSVKHFVVSELQTRLEGSPLASDAAARDGLTIVEALRREVTYRAIYMSHAEEIGRDPQVQVRRLVAEYKNIPQDRKVKPSATVHEDYLRDKIKRIVKEKADYLCCYDESRDVQGGVRPDRVALCVTTPTMKEEIDKIVQGAGGGFKVLTEEWTNPREVVFYRAVLNVPLYVFGRMDRMRDYYHRFRKLAKRSKILHIDKNWEGDALLDLDPVSAQEKNRTAKVRANIIQYAALRVSTPSGIDLGGRTFIYRRDDQWVLVPPSGLETDDGVDMTVPLGDSMSDAVEALPEKLAANPIRYREFASMLLVIQKGLAPSVVQRIVKFPMQWRSSRDDLQSQWGGNPTPEQRLRLKDLTEAYSGLAEALRELLVRLREKQGEALILGGEDYASLGVPQDVARANITASVGILQRFADDWSALENPTAKGFTWLFAPVPAETAAAVVAGPPVGSS
jgi:hypothetical protein